MSMKPPSSSYESVPFAVLVIGTDGCISSANPAAHRMLAHPNGALRGQRLDSLMREQLEQVYTVFEDGVCVRLQGRMLKADGRVLDVSLTAEPASREEDHVSSVALLCRPLPPWKTVPPGPSSLAPPAPSDGHERG
jgi:PAS domain-containing protein